MRPGWPDHDPTRQIAGSLAQMTTTLRRIEHHLDPDRPVRVRWHLGPVTHYRPTGAPRHHHPHRHHRHRRVDITMSLLDNQKVPFSVVGTDEAGNAAPFSGTPAFSVDRTDVLTLTDNGDGTGEVAATGVLGTAVLSVADTETDGEAFFGSVSLDVLASGVTGVTIQLGTPEHV